MPETKQTKGKMKTKMLVTCLVIALVVLPMKTAFAVLNNCCGMTATIVACEGTASYWMICHWLPFPEDAYCTGSSPGTPYPDAEYTSPNGLDTIVPKTASCYSTVTATGSCCGGAITTWQATGTYTYGKCAGNSCPGG